MINQVVFIRVDSSRQIGTGHVRRCLTLADKLQEKGDEVHFICRDLPGNINDFIEKAGYPLHRLPFSEKSKDKVIDDDYYSRWLTVSWKIDADQTTDVLNQFHHNIDWLIIDHYALDHRWENQLPDKVDNIMIIDDLANRKHTGRLLLDQNLHSNAEKRYERYITDTTKLLLGPQYALLRSEFSRARQNLRIRNGRVNRILVFFGGVDPGNETTKAIEAINALHRNDLIIDVVVGSSNPNTVQIKKQYSSQENINIYQNVSNMADFMAQADLSIGAGGTTTWERCCLGLPTLLVAIADNQVAISREVDRIGAAIYLGVSGEVSSEDITGKLETLLKDDDKITEMSRQAMSLVDGKGAERVVAAIQIKKKSGVIT